jgi:DNA-directed RNA polymerase alpha subunit
MEIDTIGDLVLHSEEYILKMRNLGKTSVKKIKEYLTKQGLKLSMTKDDINEMLSNESSNLPSDKK